MLFYFSSLRAQVIYNAYARVTAVTSGTLLAVSNVNETSHTFSVGQQVIVMQMQDDVIGTNTVNNTSFGNLGSIANAGVFEVANVTAVNRSAGTATSIGLSSSLVNTFNTGTNSRVQVITFRLLNAAAFTTTAAITGLAWNGNVGGVIALQVGTDLTLSHSITANGIGFRGGSVSANYYGGGTTCTTITPASSSTNHGGKGEGIFAVTSATQATGRARMINGGGGGGQDINAGGAGGGNYTAGGAGGCGWNGGSGCTTPCAGGLAGVTLSANISASRVFMGGGGGGGQQNDTQGSAGTSGGGIILIKANRIITGGCATNPTITANGINAGNAGNDGAGGAGAGGSIVLQVNSYSVSAACPLTIRANGGDGGDITASTHSGGGGGGQGVVIYSVPQPTTNITTQVNNGAPGCNNAACTTSAGAAGGASNGGIIPNTVGILPVELLYFEAKSGLEGINLSWATASQKNTSHFLVKRSTDGVNWETIGREKAAGNSNSILTYFVTDFNPPQGNVYYRITSVDFDLSEQNSPIQVIEINSPETAVVLFPNPVVNSLNVALNKSKGEFTLHIYDSTGKEVQAQIIELLDSKLSIDVSSLTQGIYFLKFVSGNSTSFVKFIVQK